MVYRDEFLDPAHLPTAFILDDYCFIENVLVVSIQIQYAQIEDRYLVDLIPVEDVAAHVLYSALAIHEVLETAELHAMLGIGLLFKLIRAAFVGI